MRNIDIDSRVLSLPPTSGVQKNPIHIETGIPAEIIDGIAYETGTVALKLTKRDGEDVRLFLCVNQPGDFTLDTPGIEESLYEIGLLTPRSST